ncbi:hypothetical protein cand_027770 [Cryptosporidium andersoni]|uniref:Uncharacterized protein n=1 Tax=Cryptosporidium andersoni TaxID=117008 RepID=A0A1J4MUM9_9CRYT|nr:hypothetical protein cand_027770 [Cryptosporidium andersoni]
MDENTKFMAKEKYYILLENNDLTKDFQIYITGKMSNIAIIRNSSNMSTYEQNEWLIGYCKIIMTKLINNTDKVKLEGYQCEDISEGSSIGYCLLLLPRDFDYKIRESHDWLKYKYMKNVIIIYVDVLDDLLKSNENFQEKRSLFEVLIRTHELPEFKYIKFIIIHQFSRFINQKYIVNDNKPLISSILYSLLENIDVYSQIKFVIID